MSQATDTNPATSRQVKSEKSKNREIAAASENGGRALNAIWYLVLPHTQKLILHFIGSETNFNGTFTEPVRVSRKALAQFICVSLKTLDVAINALIHSGYIEKIKHVDAYECNEASDYALTGKLFDDYVEFLEARWLQRSISPKAANYKRSMGMIGDSTNGGGSVESTLGGSVESTPLYSPSFSAPKIPDPESQNKAEKPCLNGGVDLIQASITPISTSKEKSPPPLGKGVPSPAEQGFLFAQSMDFIYSKRKDGGYDFKIANRSALLFLREEGPESAEVLLKWCQETRELHGRVRVQQNMFRNLWADFNTDMAMP